MFDETIFCRNAQFESDVKLYLLVFQALVARLELRELPDQQDPQVIWQLEASQLIYMSQA